MWKLIRAIKESVTKFIKRGIKTIINKYPTAAEFNHESALALSLPWTRHLFPFAGTKLFLELGLTRWISLHLTTNVGRQPPSNVVTSTIVEHAYATKGGSLPTSYSRPIIRICLLFDFIDANDIYRLVLQLFSRCCFSGPTQNE